MPEENVPKKPTVASNDPQTGAGHIDLDKVLLPKKPVPGGTLDSAQRVNAGALLEQEQKAALPKAPPPKPAPPPVEKPPEPMIPPLQTYKGDIESLIQTTNASSVSIAAAEAARRAGEPLETRPPFDWTGLLKRSGMVVGGIVLLVAAGGAIYLVYSRLNATVAIPQDAPAPFITVDQTVPIPLPEGELQRSTMMEALDTARLENTLSLGLIGRLMVYETVPGEETASYIPLEVEQFLPTLAPNVPAELMRALTGTYLLGMHTFEGSQAFLLIETDSYERGFAGMLAWERAMRGDLLPLFEYMPRPRLPEEGVATSSVGDVPQLIQTGFVDKIVDNRDTRAILNTSGDILFLWASLTPTLFVVTTNEYTFRELISRLGL